MLKEQRVGAVKPPQCRSVLLPLGLRQRHCIEVKQLNPGDPQVKCLNCRVTVRKTGQRLSERGIKAGTSKIKYYGTNLNKQINKKYKNNKKYRTRLMCFLSINETPTRSYPFRTYPKNYSRPIVFTLKMSSIFYSRKDTTLNEKK